MVGEEKDLGVRITNSLKASAHCAYVSSRENRVLGTISRTMVYGSHFDKALRKSGEASSGVLCVGLDRPIKKFLVSRGAYFKHVPISNMRAKFFCPGPIVIYLPGFTRIHPGFQQ